MLSMYPACFFKEDAGYSVVFPDLNWLATCGQTQTEAVAAAVDCLAGYLYAGRRDGETPPPPSAISDIDVACIAKELETNATDAFVNIVSVDVDLYAKENFEKSVKKTLTIPKWLNTAAEQESVNFSQVLQEALKERLGMA